MSMPDRTNLTKRQLEIYDYIKEKIASRGYGPTVREIGTAFKIRSPNGVMCHLKALEKKGMIQREGFAARAIQLVGYKPGSVHIPLLGQVAAGTPLPAMEEFDQLDLTQLAGNQEQYALRVKGDSMIEDHIQNGDYVIIKPQETARNGETIVALVEGEATLKKFYKERNRIRLDPANGQFKPIYIDPDKDVKVLGSLVGVIRFCKN